MCKNAGEIACLIWMCSCNDYACKWRHVWSQGAIQISGISNRQFVFPQFIVHSWRETWRRLICPGYIKSLYVSQLSPCRAQWRVFGWSAAPDKTLGLELLTTRNGGCAVARGACWLSASIRTDIVGACFRSCFHTCSMLLRGLSQAMVWNPDPELLVCNTDNTIFAFIWSTTVHKWSQGDLCSFSQVHFKLNCSLPWQHVLLVTAGPSFRLPRKNTAPQGWVSTAFALVVLCRRLSTSHKALIALNSGWVWKLSPGKDGALRSDVPFFTCKSSKASHLSNTLYSDSSNCNSLFIEVVSKKKAIAGWEQVRFHAPSSGKHVRKQLLFVITVCKDNRVFCFPLKLKTKARIFTAEIFSAYLVWSSRLGEMSLFLEQFKYQTDSSQLTPG